MDTDGNKILIEEGGENCDRNADPSKYGMEMTKTGKTLFSCKLKQKIKSNYFQATAIFPWKHQHPRQSFILAGKIR